MNILKKSLLHDIEVFPNFFSDIFKVPGKNKIVITGLFNGLELAELPEWRSYLSEKIPKYEIEARFIENIKSDLKRIKPYLMGYNNYHYDDIIWKYILKGNLTNKEIFELSSGLISGEKDKIKYDESIIKTIDLMRVSGCDRIFKPLKQTAANLKHELIQDLPKKFDETVEPWEIVDILRYELNDVLITEKLLFGIPEYQKSNTIPKTAHEGLLPAIEFRKEIGDKFNIDLLNYNKSQIGEKLAAKLYSEVSGRNYYDFKDQKTFRSVIKYKDIIFPNISFKTKQLQEFLNNLKILEYHPKKEENDRFTFEFEFYNSKITFAQGGIHGVHSKKKLFSETPDIEIIDLDATSFYPYLYGKYKIEPAHLPLFNEFVWLIINLRTDYKKDGNKLYANGLKLGINRIFGGFSDKHGWLYDVRALLQTTINGQLMILMLAEELELAGISVFYYNTDGITVECHKDKRKILDTIWHDWEKTTGMILEENKFSECYIKDVNNFLNLQPDGKIKSKGTYEYTSYIEKYDEFDVTGSFNMPVVSYAISEYLVKGIPIEKTIKEHDDIYDFCIAKKTGSQFRNHLFELNGNSFKENIIQQSIRFYISNSNYKVFKVKSKNEREILSLANKNGKNKVNEYIITEKDLNLNLIYTLTNGKRIYVIKNNSLFQIPFKEWLSYEDVCAGENITLFNEYFKVNNFSEYNIKYEYYIKEANKLLDFLKETQKVTKKDIQLKLF